MQKNKLNNVIVLKDVASNIVEEAIVVLKPNINIKKGEWLNIKKENISKFGKEKTIIEEAENIIKNQIVQMENKDKKIYNQKIEKKYKTLKKITMILFLVNIFCIFKIF